MSVSDDYNGPERRDPPEAMHVSVDDLSEGTKRLINRWLGLGLGGLAMTVIGSVFSLGAYLTNMQRDIGERPTRQVVEVIVAERTDSLLTEIARNGAADEIRAGAQLESATTFKLFMESTSAELNALRRDFEREHGRRQ